jgi:fructan beta-fructosidase
MLTLDRSGASNTSFSADFGLASSAPVELRDGVLDLDVWVDSTSVEVFADGGAVTISDQIMTADERTGVRVGASRPGATIDSLAVTGLDLG